VRLTAADVAVMHVPCWIASVIRHGELTALYRLNGMRNVSAINRRIRTLVAAGLLEHATTLARPVLQLSKPLLFHNPALGEFDYSILPSVSYQLERRWSQVEMQPACLYYASRRALAIFGGVMTGKVKQPNHATHDCQAAWLYVRYLRKEPALARTIVSEHASQRGRGKVPDFMCYDAENRPVLALEVGGFYPTARLASLIRDLERRQIGIELW
jgi:hypothetical protein